MGFAHVETYLSELLKIVSLDAFSKTKVLHAMQKINI